MNSFSKRSFVVIAIFIITGFIYGIRLFRLQVLDPAYKEYATNNVLRHVVQYPGRGLIYDRNGELLVHNKAAYDLLITPREVQEFDTLLLCDLLELTPEDLEIRINEAKEYSQFKPSIIVKQIPPEKYAVLQERIYKFRGFHTQSRTLREYTYPSAAHLLGYVGEVTRADIGKDSYYSMGDYIGQSGIERAYEDWLRGTKGIKKYLVDVHNRIQGSFLEGSQDMPAQTGKNIITSIDIELQMYAEKLLENKKGSVVAIEPSTGEILAMASAPGYHPGLLVGRVRSENFSTLLADTLQPLFNRALMASYPPGSTFKALNALVALEEKTITAQTHFSCSGTASLPIRCTHYHESPLDVVDAMRESCNPFLWNTFRSIISSEKTSAEGFNKWHEYVLSFGMGKKLGIDLPVELKGNVPEEAFFNRYYGEGRWNAMTVRSLSIGQGELGVTPLQLANFSAILANRGHYYIPHVVKDIEGGELASRLIEKREVPVAKEHFEPVIKGMQQVVEKTNASAFMKIPNVTMAGKTGTAENPHGEDHSIFMAFAPVDNPQIAISVYVENAGYGAVWAAPIASLLVEKYLTGTISKQKEWVEKRMLEANLLTQSQTE
ncbi:MAG: penicillin-binding protein 2 [Tangfeifania sp.]